MRVCSLFALRRYGLAMGLALGLSVSASAAPQLTSSEANRRGAAVLTLGQQARAMEILHASSVLAGYSPATHWQIFTLINAEAPAVVGADKDSRG